MDVSEVLSRAWTEVEKAGLPAELHPAAFVEAVRLIAGDAVGAMQAPPSGGKSRGGAGRAAGARKVQAAPRARQQDDIAVDPEEFYEKIADETGVDRDKLERLIHFDGATPRLNLPARKLGDNLKSRMVAVAQILPVARHYGLDENETSTRVVREECDRLKCLDAKNINTYLGDLDGITYAGPRDNKVLKVRPAGVTAFVTTVDNLLGEASREE